MPEPCGSCGHPVSMGDSIFEQNTSGVVFHVYPPCSSYIAAEEATWD